MSNSHAPRKVWHMVNRYEPLLFYYLWPVSCHGPYVYTHHAVGTRIGSAPLISNSNVCVARQLALWDITV